MKLWKPECFRASHAGSGKMGSGILEGLSLLIDRAYQVQLYD